MPNVKPCPICSLEDDLLEKVEGQIDLGLSNSDVAAFIRDNGGTSSITARTIDNHKRHRTVKKASESNVTVESILSLPKSLLACSEEGLDAKTTSERLRRRYLEVFDILANEFHTSHSLRVARVFNEVGITAFKMVQEWSEAQGGQGDFIMNINLMPDDRGEIPQELLDDK